MKFKLILGNEHDEEVIVYAREKSKFTDAVERLCTEEGMELIGYKDREAVMLNPAEINCFIVEDNKIFALTAKEKLQLKCRLYNIEAALPEGFVKINQSCIANLKSISRFDASLGGTLTVKFKNGYQDYVSRRNLKNVKERLGL